MLSALRRRGDNLGADRCDKKLTCHTNSWTHARTRVKHNQSRKNLTCRQVQAHEIWIFTKSRSGKPPGFACPTALHLHPQDKLFFCRCSRPAPRLPFLLVHSEKVMLLLTVDISMNVFFEACAFTSRAPDSLHLAMLKPWTTTRFCECIM